MRRISLALTVLFGVATAYAQDAGDIAAARPLGTEGLRLAESGNCAAAVEKLARAEKLFHAPTTLGRLGECQVALGHYVEGTESLRRVARERLEPSAPHAFFAAQTRAKEALEAALPKLAKLRIEVVGPQVDDVILRIDGQSVSSATVGVERPMDPGAHLIEASATNFKAAQSRVQLTSGTGQTVSLTLERMPTAVTTQPLPVSDHGAPVPETTRREYLPAIIAYSAGGAGLLLGGIFGGVAVAKKNDLVSTCGGTACTPAQRSSFDSLSTMATVSTVGFVIAGLGAATGIVLTILAPKHSTVHAAVAPLPGGVALLGLF